MFSRVSTADADGESFGDRLGQAEQFGHGAKRAAEIIGIESGDDHLLAAIGELAGDIDQVGAEEIRLVDADYLRAPVELLQDFRGTVDRIGFHALIAVGDDFVDGVSIVDGRFEDLHALAGDAGAAEAAD